MKLPFLVKAFLISVSIFLLICIFIYILGIIGPQTIDILETGLPSTKETFDNSDNLYSCIAYDNINNKNAIHSLLSLCENKKFWEFINQNQICPFSIDGISNMNVSYAIDSSIKTCNIIHNILKNIELSYSDKTMEEFSKTNVK
jgi:hypothetical protein